MNNNLLDHKSNINDKNELFDLSNLSVLQVLGERGSEFLQGQLTCDLREINATRMHSAAFCGVNGRVLAVLDVVDWRGLYLILPEDLCTQTSSSLSKAASFSRVQIIQSNNLRVLGVRLNNPNCELPFDLHIPAEQNGVVSGIDHALYHVHDNFYIMLVNASAVDATNNWFKRAGWLMLERQDWHVLQLQTRRASINADSRGMFFPHRMELQNTGHISFNKGCYRGQEIIARMHYRSQVKHELRVLRVESASNIIPGTHVISSINHEKIGEVIDACVIQNDLYIILISVLRAHTTDVSLASVVISCV